MVLYILIIIILLQHEVSIRVNSLSSKITLSRLRYAHRNKIVFAFNLNPFPRDYKIMSQLKPKIKPQTQQLIGRNSNFLA